MAPPVADRDWAYDVPTVPVGSGLAVVMVGGIGAGAMVIEKLCVALGTVPLAEVIVPLKVPLAPGVPEITPPAPIVRPVGKAPALTEKVIGVLPDAVQLWL